MPSKKLDGTPITSMDELLKAWQTFLGHKFACAGCPGAAFAPGIAEKWPDEDIVTWEEFDECVQALRSDHAAGSDETPIEVYIASPSAKQELYKLVCLMWRKEEIPSELVRALFVMLYKKGSRDDFSNYRAIGLLCPLLQGAVCAGTAKNAACPRTSTARHTSRFQEGSWLSGQHIDSQTPDE